MPDIEMAGSFLIGGMLLLSILALNASIMETATMNSLGTNAQENVTVIVSILDYDFRKMGYRVASDTTAIRNMTSTTITFLGDVDDNGSVDTVNYYLGPTSEPTGTDNPNDRYLYRNINGTAFDVALGMTTWNLSYYGADGTVTATPASVRSIRVTFTVQSMVPFDTTYGEARWEGRFSPKNLAG